MTMSHFVKSSCNKLSDTHTLSALHALKMCVFARLQEVNIEHTARNKKVISQIKSHFRAHQMT